MIEACQRAAARAPWASSLGAGPGQVSIDPNGNLASKTEGTDNWVYTWNAENQLTKVEKNGAEVARFAYDPGGRRVEKVVGGAATLYVYEDTDILRESRAGATRTYVHGTAIDEPLAVDDGMSLAYFHADALGSIAATTSSAGSVASTRRFDPWGVIQLGGGESGYAFTGREWDPEAALYYYRARYYEPTIGRFVSEDPVGFDGGVNFYAYAENGPTVWVDPMGLQVTTNKPPAMPPRGRHTGTEAPTGPAGMALFCIWTCVGTNFTISGGQECTPQGTHVLNSRPGSKHCTNQAFDVPTREVTRIGPKRFFCCAKKCGIEFILDEGSWFHFQVVPGRNRSRGLVPDDQECSAPCLL